MRAANQLARFLVREGVRPGDRIGLLSDRAVDGYLGMLAVLKARAAYVPLDPRLPAGPLVLHHLRRRGTDGAVALASGGARGAAGGHGQPAVPGPGDRADRRAELGPARATARPARPPTTSATSSTPRARPGGRRGWRSSTPASATSSGWRPRCTGCAPADRVYQGMTIAFDFSVEEIWVPWMAGATLVPKPDGARRCSGGSCTRSCADRRVTAMCCVPTLLATLDEDLPALRFLLVSGEPCPQDLVARWHRPGRRFLNVYGPTEATVTATWTRAASRQAGDDRGPAADLLRGRPRSRQPTGPCRRARSGRSASPGSGWPAATSTARS